MLSLLLIPALAGWHDQLDRDGFRHFNDMTPGSLAAVAVGGGAEGAAAAICSVEPGCPVTVVGKGKGKKDDLALAGEVEARKVWVVRPVAGLDDTVVASFVVDGSVQGRGLFTAGEPLAAPALGAMAAEELEAVVAQRDRCLEDAANRPAPRPAIDADAERAAAEILKAATAALEALDYEEARARLDELDEKYGSTRAARASRRIRGNLDIIGREVSDTLAVTRWFQGDGFSPADHELTLMVFWEVWCPHCKREVPKLQQLHEEWSERGVGVVGITRLTRNVTEEQAETFISEKGLTYAMAVGDGTLSEHLGISGIPAAAMVRDGVVVWRGHPARINDEMLEGLLE